VIREFKNPIAAGDLKWIFERNCKDAEKLRIKKEKNCCFQAVMDT